MNFKSLINYLIKAHAGRSVSIRSLASPSIDGHFSRVLVNVLEIESDAKLRPLPRPP